ncbi:MAG: multidrug effflux MFS transporter [Firmicutes bacterium]|nr:multidrug effflux MFS transporter [Bacillota bacterium]
MFIPLSIDMYLPALPAMSDYFGASQAVTNLTLSAFFFSYGCGILIWGPLSDKYGRRSCLLVSTFIYVLAGAGCALAGEIYFLIFCRILQGLGAGGTTSISLAIVKDSFSGRLREKVLVIVIALSGIAPVVGPLIGAMILLFADFKLVFWLLSFVGIVSLILTLLLEETLAEEKRYSGPLIRTMGQVFVVLKNKSFLWLVIIFSLGSLPFMGYIAISSYVYEIYFGLSEQMFSIYFAANACAFILGPFLYYRFFRGYDNDFLIRGNFILCIIFGIAVMVFGSYAPWAFWFAFMPISLIVSGIRPLATNLMLEQQQDSTGTASSLINATNSVFGSLGTLIASITWGNIILSFGSILVIFSVLPLTAWLIFMRLPIPCLGVKKAGQFEKKPVI